MSSIALIKSLVDKDEVILVRKPFVRLCGGSIQAAMMLSQILYWTDGKTKIYGGWIAKTSAQWKEELCFATDYEVKTARTVLERIGVIETMVKKFNGNPTVHYRLLSDKFLNLLSAQIGFVENHQNDLLLDAKSITETTSETTNNTANDEKPVVAMPCSHIPADITYICARCHEVVPAEKNELPVEWQIAAGIKEVSLPDQQDAKMKDAANIIAMGPGLGTDAYNLAYTFMKTRGIIIPENKLKNQRKVVKEMLSMGVQPKHIVAAIEKLTTGKKKLTVTDLYSVAKTAEDLANPAPGEETSADRPEGYTGASTWEA